MLSLNSYAKTYLYRKYTMKNDNKRPRQQREQVQKIMIARLIGLLGKDITELNAYTLKLIDKRGRVIRKPVTDAERRALNPTVMFMLDLRKVLEEKNFSKAKVKIWERRHGMGTLPLSQYKSEYIAETEFGGFVSMIDGSEDFVDSKAFCESQDVVKMMTKKIMEGKI